MTRPSTTTTIDGKRETRNFSNRFPSVIALTVPIPYPEIKPSPHLIIIAAKESKILPIELGAHIRITYWKPERSQCYLQVQLRNLPMEKHFRSLTTEI